MGFINNLKDHFKSAEFTVSPGKKVKTVCADFKKAFGCTLAIYKGNMLAEGDLTINQLDKHTSKKVDTRSEAELKIKASMLVGEAEKLFEQTYGLKVQIKDPEGKICVDNKLTIGQAARGESK